MLLICCWMPTVGRLLSQGEMSHSYCTKILKYFSFHSVSGQEDKFDPKRRKTRHIVEKGTMFSRLVMAFSKGNSIEINSIIFYHCFIALLWAFNFSPFYISNNMLFRHMSASFEKCPQSTDSNSWHHPVKIFSWNSRSLDISSYLGFDSSAKPSGSQRSRKSEACNYWNRLGLPWGKCDSFAVCYNCVMY